MKWAALLEFDVPVDLLEAMRVQKTACETIIGTRCGRFCSSMWLMKHRDERRAYCGVPKQPEGGGRGVREDAEEAGAAGGRAAAEHDGEVRAAAI